MSDANVENLRLMLAVYSTQTIHELLEEWRRGEVDPAFLALVDPEFTYEDYGSGDGLVATHRFRARARYTGIEFDQPSAYVYTFRDGKIIRIQGFWDPEDALAAAGLEE